MSRRYTSSLLYAGPVRRREFGHSHGSVSALPVWDCAGHAAEGCARCGGAGWLPATETQPQRVCGCLRPHAREAEPSPFHLALERMRHADAVARAQRPEVWT